MKPAPALALTQQGAGARALLHRDLQALWRASGERLDGAGAFIEVNARYPEGWTIRLVDLALLRDGRAMSVVRVDQPPQHFALADPRARTP